MVTLKNYEEYLMLAADGELDDAGQEALQIFLDAHPEHAGEAAAWKALRLMPDTTLVYAEKEALLKKRPVIIPRWPGMLAAAAGLALLLSVAAFWKPDGITGSIPVAALIPAAAPAIRPAPPVPDSIAALPVAVVAAMHSERRKASVQRRVIMAGRHPAIEEIAPVMPAPAREITADIVVIHPQPVAVQTAPARLPEALTPVDRRHSGGFPVIHFAPANQHALAALKRGFDERIAQASATAKSVKEATLARINNGPLHVEF